ncbi:hypothetical protein AB0910_27950 [Streptomyces sp. NPDC047002]
MPDAAMTPLWTQQLFDVEKDAAAMSDTPSWSAAPESTMTRKS